MQFDVITLFPEMFAALTQSGITRRAFEQEKCALQFWNPRDFTTDRHRTVDDRPYGGGPGMVMLAKPLQMAIHAAKERQQQLSGSKPKVIYLSPQGKPMNHARVMDWSAQEGLILLCGRYEGVDERLIQKYVDQEWSIGDYVLSGGELPAMVLLDSIIRRLPGAMSDEQSHVQDSFVDGLLDCPQYTKPDHFEGLDVPEVLKSGHHANIEKWRFLQRYQRTQQRRPELVDNVELTKQQKKWLTDLNT